MNLKKPINNRFVETTIALTEWREQVFIHKKKRVVEEIEIKKNVINRGASISETLKKNKINIERS